MRVENVWGRHRVVGRGPTWYPNILKSHCCSQKNDCFRHPVDRFDGGRGAVQAVQDALTLLRKNDIDTLYDTLLDHQTRHMDDVPEQRKDSIESIKSVHGNVLYVDGSVLARHCDVFDVGARRLLPSNLLRRSQVLSVLPIPAVLDDVMICCVRTKISSTSGEEGIIMWTLVHRDELAGWRVTSANIEGPNALLQENDLPGTLHPRYSPESIIQAYLIAIKNGEYVHAQSFCNGIVFSELQNELQARGYLKNESSMLFLEATSKACFDAITSRYPHRCFLENGECVWGKGLLLDQKHMVQEIAIVGQSSPEWHHWLFHTSIQDHLGCWAIDNIVPVSTQ